MQAFFFLSVCVFMLLFLPYWGLKLGSVHSGPGLCHRVTFLTQAALPEAHLSRLCRGDTTMYSLEGQ